MRGSLKMQPRQQRCRTSIPNWKLYENPFFTEGYVVPKCLACARNAHPHKTISASEAQFDSRGSELNLAIESHAKPFKTYAAASMQYFPPLHLPSDRGKFRAGSVVSARKLAAVFWELYGGQRCQNCDFEKQSLHAGDPHSHLVSLRPYSPSDYKLCDVEVETTETAEAAPETNMASSQTTILANVLHRVRTVEEREIRTAAALHMLTLDLEDVANRVQELELSQQSALREVTSLMQKFGENMVVTRKKEQEKLKLQYSHLLQEMEEERDSCRLLKKQNKKLAKDLTNANMAIADAGEELERERKARELMEEVCNELAREIGEDKAEVELMKQEQEMYREILEEELRSTRMMVLWQDERGEGKAPELNAQVLEGDGNQFMPVKHRGKLGSFRQISGVQACGNTGLPTKLCGSADTELDHTNFEPVNLDHGKLSHEANGGQNVGVNAATTIRGLSIRSDEACCGIMAKSQGCMEVQKKDEENVPNEETITFSTIQESNKINIEGNVDSGDETIRILGPAKSLQLTCFGTQSPDASPAFAGAMKGRIKTCSPSPPGGQDGQRLTSPRSGLYSYAHSDEDEKSANQQPLGLLKANSLAAQLIRARELEEEAKPIKPSCFSPLRQAVPYG